MHYNRLLKLHNRSFTIKISTDLKSIFIHFCHCGWIRSYLTFFLTPKENPSNYCSRHFKIFIPYPTKAVFLPSMLFSPCYSNDQFLISQFKSMSKLIRETFFSSKILKHETETFRETNFTKLSHFIAKPVQETKN